MSIRSIHVKYLKWLTILVYKTTSDLQGLTDESGHFLAASRAARSLKLAWFLAGFCSSGALGSGSFEILKMGWLGPELWGNYLLDPAQLLQITEPHKGKTMSTLIAMQCFYNV